MLVYLYVNETFTLTAKRLRPRLTTPEEDERIRRAPTETSFITATEIREALNLQVSATSVRRRLHEAGIQHKVLVRKEPSPTSMSAMISGHWLFLQTKRPSVPSISADYMCGGKITQAMICIFGG